MHYSVLHIPQFPQNLKIFPYLHKIYLFILNLRVMAYPYFDNDAFMHHALHVLDAPA